MNHLPRRKSILIAALIVLLFQTQAHPASAAIRSDGLVTGELTYHGGNVMPNPTNYLIFWLPSGRSFEPSGSAYTDAQFEGLMQQYFQDVCGTKYYNVLTPLSFDPANPTDPVVSHGPIQNSCSYGGSWVDTTAYPHAGSQADPLNDGDIRNAIQRARTANSSWVSGSNAEYFVYTGFGIQECDSSECTFPTAPSGPAFCAYHTYWSDQDIVYAFISAGISSCVVGTAPNNPVADSAADTSSHEQFEAVSDPGLDAWYNGDGSHENGDQCNFYFGSADKNSDGTNLIFNSHRYRLQWEWLNQLGSADSSGDYGNSGCAPSYSHTDGGIAHPDDPTGTVSETALPTAVAGNSGDSIQLTFNYANTSGTDGAYNASLQVNLAPSLRYSSTSVGPAPVQSGNQLTYTIGTLGVGASGSIVLQVAVTGAQPDGTTMNTNGVFSANDQLGGVAFFPSANANITVQNSPPTFRAIADQSVDYNDPLSFNVLADDVNSGDTLTMTVGGLPAGLSFSDHGNGFGTVSGTVTAAPGTYPVTFSVNDGHHADVTTTANIVVTREESAISYTGDVAIAAGGNVAHLSGVLTEDGAIPLMGRTLTLTLGTGASSQSCTTGPTDVTGAASCTISPVTVPLGPQTVTAGFAGDTYYLPSSGTASAIVFGFLSRGAFSLGDRTVAGATSSTKVTWWSDSWYQLNSLSGGQAPSSYKGFMAVPNSTPPVCGGTFTTTTGNSVVPPAGVPSYMGIAVTDRVSKNGSTMSGKITKIVVVRTNPGYAASPVSPGTGSIVATYCQ